jgi:uncharacterized membrane protein
MTLLALALAAAPHDGFHHGPPWIIVPFLLGLWLLAGATVGLFLLSRGARLFSQRERDGLDRAMDILAERFASGEMTAEEYHLRVSQLR